MSRNFIPEQDLIDQFLNNDATAFEELSRRYCYSLYAYCIDKLNSPEDARRVVRCVFICLWENRQSLPFDFSLPVYLYTEIRKSVIQCLNNKLNNDTEVNAIEEDILEGFSAARLQKAKLPVKYTDPKSVVPSVPQGKGSYVELRWKNHSPVYTLKGLKHAFQNMLNLL